MSIKTKEGFNWQLVCFNCQLYASTFTKSTAPNLLNVFLSYEVVKLNLMLGGKEK